MGSLGRVSWFCWASCAELLVFFTLELRQRIYQAADPSRAQDAAFDGPQSLTKHIPGVSLNSLFASGELLGKEQLDNHGQTPGKRDVVGDGPFLPDGQNLPG